METPATTRPRPSRSTLLVFTLGARAEGRRRRLLPPRLRSREEALYDACLDEALAAGRGAGCRLEVSSPGVFDLPADVGRRPQTSGCFGERLAAAFDAAGPSPEEPVVAVGTDTPGLRPEHVARALGLLGDPAGRGACGDRVVVGPSPDGGLYLLAASRPLGELLRRVPWRRSRTLAALRRTLVRAGLEVELLPPLADLDRPADLEGWLARGDAAPSDPALRRLAATLARLLAALRRPLLPTPSPGLRPAPVPVRSGRSPPSGRSARSR